MTKQEKEAEEYRQYRYVCGLKDPVTLNEIEEAYYQGMLKQKELMMKEAIDGEVRCFANFADYVESEGFCASDRHLSRGDNVKLIIVKE